MSDANYGSSHYRQGKPISSRLKVAAGSNKPANSREQKSKFNPQPLTTIKRGSRDETLWMKRRKLKDSIATVETSSIYEADELLFENPEAIDDSDEAII